MNNEIVKYNNFMNNLSLGTLGQGELDLLMTICAKIRDLGTDEVEFTFGEIRGLAELKNCDSRERFIKAISSLNKKLINISGHIDNEEEEVFFTLFNELKTLKNEGLLKVSVNPKYSFVLNELTANFTVFELKEFVNLKSKYSKNLFRLLKQFDNIDSCWRTFNVDDLREKLGCPKNYANKRFVAEILNPCVDELKHIFLNLTMDVVKARRKGSPIQQFDFRWTPTINDYMPGQMHLFDFLDDTSVSTDEKNKTLKIANDILKGKKKKKVGSFEGRKYDFEELEKQLIDNK